jgi:hypothetical protein
VTWHLVPPPYAFFLLALGAYRLTRLGGWDDWPPIYRLRAFVIGEEWVPDEGAAPELPGKTPDSEVADVRPSYRRPLLAHLVHCPFCLGWWVSLGCYLAYLLAGRWALVALAPFAISGAVGLVAKNLDP